jgi:nicotinamidase-related amidase
MDSSGGSLYSSQAVCLRYNEKSNKSIYLSGGNTMQKKALVVIDIQNDITKNYKDIIANINKAIDWAVGSDIHVVYIRHENLSAGTRTFKPDTRGSELASDLKIASKNVFTKYKGNALSSEEFAGFISKNEIGDFYIAGADAVACVKSTCYNLRKANYGVTVLSDCVTSYDKRKIPEMLRYYESKGSEIICLNDLLG